uniref:Similar to PIE1 (PHOTOPERIOD-INDEPENDENT EARLY FLOWERING 1) n=1 Tax=Arundo donax TaxID=35708 RepID=A0A0A9D6K8_ARUDO
MKSSYKFLCLLESLQYMTCSCFFGNCFSTSRFNRRSINGRRTLCNRSITSLLTLSWPSTIPEIGLQNQSLNSW